MENNKTATARKVELVRSEAERCRAQAKYFSRLHKDCEEVAEALEAAALALEEKAAKAEGAA